MFTPSDKMYLLASEPQVLPILNRFGLPLGVGERSVDSVCHEHGIHTNTFLCMVNRQTSEDVHIPTLKTYLNNSHTYFLDFALPRIRQELIEAINLAQNDSQVPMLIVKFFDEYVEEVRTHIIHENQSQYLNHKDDDVHIAGKLNELKNLIIMYYPSREFNALLYNTLHDIYDIEQEIQQHCAIEDEILLPAMKKVAAQKKTIEDATEERDGLSEREKEVLVQVVNGLSNKEIADVLCISTHTVISHRKNIARKLNIHSTAGLTIYAIVNNLVRLEDLKAS